MSAEQMVRWTQVRLLLRLMREADELLAAGSDPTLHVIGGLGGIVGADASATADATDFHPTGKVEVGTIISTGLRPDEIISVFSTYKLEGAAADPVVPVMATRHGANPVITCTRWESVTKDQWDRSMVAEGLRPFRESLYSTRLTGDDNTCNGVMLLRRNKPFDDEAKNLIRLFHLECYRRLDQRRSLVAVCKTIESLPMRQREALECLLKGDSEKRAAERMGVSPHTLHNYAKALYTAFGVSSRAELLALCLRVNSGMP
jgi:DNA-binding CsgD family transcriptional regulator